MFCGFVVGLDMVVNMYRVGDYVYFENFFSNLYLICRIEEFNKIVNGNVEVKVVCFYRRWDIFSSFIVLVDKYVREVEEEVENLEMVDLFEKFKY